jgi:hypothetical protein
MALGLRSDGSLAKLGGSPSCSKTKRPCWTAKLPHGPIATIAGSFLLLGLDLNDLDTLVVAAGQADMVRKPQLATLWAGDELGLFECQVAAPAIASALGYLSLW